MKNIEEKPKTELETESDIEMMIASPYKGSDIAMIQTFEEKLGWENVTKVSDILIGIRNSMSEATYKKKFEDSNFISQNLYSVRENKIKNSCYLEGHRDTKACTLDFMPLPNPSLPSTSLSMLKKATAYAEQVLGMETILLAMPITYTSSFNKIEELGYSRVEGPNNNEINTVSFVKTAEKVKDTNKKI